MMDWTLVWRLCRASPTVRFAVLWILLSTRLCVLNRERPPWTVPAVACMSHVRGDELQPGLHNTDGTRVQRSECMTIQYTRDQLVTLKPAPLTRNSELALAYHENALDAEGGEEAKTDRSRDQ